MSGNDISPDQREFLQLLQLPETALGLVLQKLDPGSLANTAATCSKLSDVFPGYISSVTLTGDHVVLGNFISWLDENSSSLKHLTNCSLSLRANLPQPRPLNRLACPHLRQLRLYRLRVQLGPGANSPGVLAVCTALTALEMQDCLMNSQQSGCAAIAALPELQQLRILAEQHSGSFNCVQIFPAFQHPLKLTHLTINNASKEEFQKLSCLSALVNLQHLELARVASTGYAGGWPSQLVRLTCLHLEIDPVSKASCDVREQFQHLSHLTALQELKVRCKSATTHQGFPGIQHLPQLTRLKLAVGYYTQRRLEISTSCIHSWACRTALQSLGLRNCSLQPGALAALSQLRALSVGYTAPLGDASAEELLLAVSQLTLLTQLRWFELCHDARAKTASSAAFTALAVSTKRVQAHVQG